MHGASGTTGYGPALVAAAPVVFVLLWSTGPVAAKVGVADVAALELLAWRFAVLALVTGAFGLATGRLLRLAPRAAAHCAVAGLLIQASYLGCGFTAMQLGMTAGFSALITGFQPVAAAVFASWLLDERLGRGQLAGMALALAGLALYAGHQVTAAGLAPFPLGLHLAGVVAIGAGIVYQRRFCSRVDLLDNVTVQYIAGALAVGGVAALLPTGGGTWTLPALGALAWLVIVLSLGATTLLVFLVNHGHVAGTASLFFLMPPTTAVMAGLYLGEALSATTVTGLVVATTGVALVMRSRPGVAAPPEPD